jgi:hypothetical protein
VVEGLFKGYISIQNTSMVDELVWLLDIARMKTASKVKAAQVVSILFNFSFAKQKFAHGLFHTVYLLMVYSTVLLIAQRV